MRKRKDKISPRLAATLATCFMLIIWLLAVVAVVVIDNLEWKLYPLILLRLLVPVVTTLVLVFLVSFIFVRDFEAAILTTLVVIGTIFIFASVKDTNVREILFPVINELVDVNLLVAGVTLLAFAVALGTLAKRSNSKSKSPEDKFTSDTGTVIQRFRKHYGRKMRLEQRYRKRVRRVKRGW